jgi:phospholipase C
VPEVALWPRNILRYHDHLHPIERFHDDCRAGALPQVSLITTETQFLSEGEYQDDQLGESFTAWIYESLRTSRQWPGLMFIIPWDEGGGFYDHVPPPAAVAPDDVPPDIHVPPDQPGGYDVYGFRVPCIVVSPFSKPGHVSSLVYDHTSILATIEQRWDLKPLTRRDAAALPLWDFLDLDARPALLDPPALPEPRIWPFPS